MYKPVIAQPSYHPRADGHKGPAHACIVCAVNEDKSVNLLVFSAEGDVTFIKNAALVQADADGCPCHFTDPEPVLKPAEHS